MCCLTGHRTYGWKFIGTDIDPESISNAQNLIDVNALSDAIRVHTVSAGTYIAPVVSSMAEGVASSPAPAVFDFCMCNPPFFEDVADACANPKRGTLGTLSELCTPGACEIVLRQAI